MNMEDAIREALIDDRDFDWIDGRNAEFARFFLAFEKLKLSFLEALSQ